MLTSKVKVNVQGRYKYLNLVSDTLRHHQHKKKYSKDR